MLGVPTALKGFFPGDDAQETDVYDLIALTPALNTAVDLLWNNRGTAGPVTPTNYTAKIVSLLLVNGGASAGKFTLYALNTVAATSSFIPVAEYYLAATSALQVSTDQFRVNAPPNCKFQVIASTSGDVVASARYIKGAGQ